LKKRGLTGARPAIDRIVAADQKDCEIAEKRLICRANLLTGWIEPRAFSGPRSIHKLTARSQDCYNHAKFH
jgi:hypothetical protein